MELKTELTVLMIWAALIGCVFSGLTGQAQAKTIFIRTLTDQQSIHGRFDLSLWEDGKKNNSVRRTWDMKLTLQDGKPVSGSLYSRTIWKSGNNEIGASEIKQHHSIGSGSLKIFKADMENGILVFEIRYEGGSRLPVCIRFTPLTESGNYLEIASFDARQVVASYYSDTLVSQEWRIPVTAYPGSPLLAPEKMMTASGMVREDGIDLLSESDKEILGNVLTGGKCVGSIKSGSRDLILKGIVDCLEKAGMSPEGQKQAAEFILAIFCSM